MSSIPSLTVLPESLRRHSSDGPCFLCSLGWFWQAQLGVTSQTWRRDVLAHRLLQAQTNISGTEEVDAGRGTWCASCETHHMWSAYVPIGKGSSKEVRDEMMDGQRIENCRPPPWICRFGDGVVIDSSYRALLYLCSPYWGAYEIVTAAQGECDQWKPSPNLARSTSSHQGIDNESDDDENVGYRIRHVSGATWQQQKEARLALGGVRLTRKEHDTLQLGDLGDDYIPREVEDIQCVCLAAALFWDLRMGCQAEHDWLLTKALDEIVEHLCALARHYFSRGQRAIIGYVDDMLGEDLPGGSSYRGYWTKWFIAAHSIRHRGTLTGYRSICGNLPSREASLDIYFDGRWSFPNKVNYTDELRQFIHNHIWISNEVLCKKLRQECCGHEVACDYATRTWPHPQQHTTRVFASLDIDNSFGEVFEQYASNERAVRIAGFRYDEANWMLRRTEGKGGVHVALEKHKEIEYGVSGADIVSLRKCNQNLLLVLNVGRNDLNFAVRIYGKKMKGPIIDRLRRGRPNSTDDVAAALCPCLIGFARTPDAEISSSVEVSMRKATVLDPENLVFEELSRRVVTGISRDTTRQGSAEGCSMAAVAIECSDVALRPIISPTRVEVPEAFNPSGFWADELKACINRGDFRINPLSNTFASLCPVPCCFLQETPLWAMEPEIEGVVLCDAQVGEERHRAVCFIDEFEDHALSSDEPLKYVLETTLKETKVHVRRETLDDVCAISVTRENETLSLELINASGAKTLFCARITAADDPDDYKLAMLFDYLPQESVFRNESDTCSS